MYLIVFIIPNFVVKFINNRNSSAVRVIAAVVTTRGITLSSARTFYDLRAVAFRVLYESLPNRFHVLSNDR